MQTTGGGPVTRRHDDIMGLATLWLAAVATIGVALRGGSVLLALLALPLLGVAVRMTLLERRRVRPMKPTPRHCATHTGARVIRIRANPPATRPRRSTAA
jgi:hypothetical protein